MFKRVNREHKLNVIKSLLNGTMSFEHLRPPQIFSVYLHEDGYHLNDKVFTKDEYEQWKSTLNDWDRIILFSEFKDYSNDPLLTESELATQQERERYGYPLPNNAFTKPVESPVISSQQYESSVGTEDEINVPDVGKIEVELFAIPVKKPGGLLSQYDETWLTRMEELNEN